LSGKGLWLYRKRDMKPICLKAGLDETPLKIALCLFKYFPHGGLQRDFLRIAAWLAEKYSITVFSTSWEGEIPSYLSVRILSVTGLTNHQRLQRFGKKAVEQAKQEDCAFIISFNKFPGIDVYFAADNCYAEHARKKNLLYRLTPRYRGYFALEKAVFAKISHTKILALTYQQKMAYQNVYGTADERFYVLPPDFNVPSPPTLLSSSPSYPPVKAGVGQACAEGERNALRQSYGIKPEDYLVLMVCSAFKTKGVDRALKAIKKLPPALIKKIHLVIIGKDKPEPYLQLAKILQLNLKMQFLGARNDVLEHMLASDLLLHPAYKEAAGKVLLEAIACGLPVLTTAQCGYAPYIEKVNSGIVVPEDVSDEGLAKALALMLNSSERENWKQNALTYMAQHPFGDFAIEAANAIERMMGFSAFDNDRVD
jgi:UDP-glucose:(heptosyl)LPS alpha-1,3-glucosyltransferase